MAITPAVVPLRAPRHVPFVYEIAITGIDLTGAVMVMSVKLLPDTPDPPLIELAGQPAGTEGLSRSVDSGGPVPVSTIVARIDEATLEALPPAAELGDDLTLYYDLKITPDAGDAGIYFRGTFTVEAGVTF